VNNVFGKNNKEEIETERRKILDELNGKLNGINADVKSIEKMLNYSSGAEAEEHRYLLGEAVIVREEIIKDIEFFKAANMVSAEKANQLISKIRLKEAERLNRLAKRLDRMAKKAIKLGEGHVKRISNDVSYLRKRGILIKDDDAIIPGIFTAKKGLDLHGLAGVYRSNALTMLQHTPKGRKIALKWKLAETKRIEKLAAEFEKRAGNLEKRQAKRRLVR